MVLKEADWQQWFQHFAGSNAERMAFGYCGSIRTEDETQFLVQSVDLPGESEYRHQGAAGVSLKAEHVIPRVMQARTHAALVDGHSHPFTSRPSPSGTDDVGAQRQFRVLRDLAPGTALIRMISGCGGSVWAEVSPPGKLCWSPVTKIVILGREGRREVVPINSPRPTDRRQLAVQDARTAAVLGKDATARVRTLKVLVIAAGGVGSAVIAQLRGYVDDITVVDPDVVEPHNAPRLYHYVSGDEGRPKVEIHAREIQRSFPSTRVRAICGRFPEGPTLDAFKRADAVFCCPDYNLVRYNAAQFGVRFFKPVIEVGCGGKAWEGQIVALGYHVRLQVPGDICLACNGLDLTDLEDPSSSEMKRRAGYVIGGDLVLGELMPLTTRAAADAVDLFFRYVTGYARPVPRHLYYDALRLVTIDATTAYHPQPLCSLCGEDSATLAGAGDALSEDQQVLPAPGEIAHAA
jgi:molybdopterin/thiamine biosynthesis adenylyltransferase